MSTDQLDVGGEREPRAIAAQLWPLAELDREMAAFVERWRPAAADPPADLAQAASSIFAASIEFEELVRRDPLLSRELTPTGWRGLEMRSIYRTLVEAVSKQHPTIGRANLFAAFLDTIDNTANMPDDDFWPWLWSTTRPR